MIHILFGNFLKNAGKLSAEQLSHVYEEQKKVRVKLGLIAVSEKMMSLEQADEVNKLQSTLDKRFGDIAVERGYLTDEQVGRLLGKQGNLYLSFVQEITNENLMTLEEVEEEFAKFQKELSFTQSDMDLLKSGDADLMIPLFLPLEMDELQKNHILVCVKTLMRLIDNDLYIDKAYRASSTDTVNYALQELKGDGEAFLAFSGEADALLPIASKFGEEDFKKVDLDALDACAELINCINGMFASDCAPKFNIDMLPPVYAEGKFELSAGKIDGLCVLPVYVKGNRVNVVSAFRDKIIAKGVN
ncbi:MAG: chemotaxis protein CheX [Lachnospiraceae bacterium]|nr:chemotaxis protein CheX [Lachnospiraceae bacterium]